MTFAGQYSDATVADQYSDLPSQAQFETVSNINVANNGVDSRLPQPIIENNPTYDAIKTKSNLGYLECGVSTDDSDE